MAKPYSKTVYMLWLQGFDAAPELVKRCVKTWEVQNPDWAIEFLDQTDVDALWTTEQEKKVAKKTPESALANMVRMKLLQERGGVWADATTVCQVPLDNWLPLFFGGGFFGFHRPVNGSQVANWFLASGADNYLMRRWLKASLGLWSKDSVQERDTADECGRYTRRLQQDGRVWLKPGFWKDIKRLPYYWHMYLFDYLCLRDKKFQELWTSVPKCSIRVPLLLDQGKSVQTDVCTDEEFQHLIRNNMAPFHKLNWRRFDPATMPRVDWLLRYCSNEL